MRSIRVMIVEDSAAVRTLLEHILTRDARFEICASVTSAEAAIKLLDRAAPDVISMDVYLPGMTGIEAIGQIMQKRPTPTVVVSAAVRDEQRISIDALRAGALAVVEKPPGPGDSRHVPLTAALCNQLALMSQVKVVRQRRFARVRAMAAPPAPAPEHGYAMVGIVASTGGPGTLEKVLGSLAPDFPLPILLVQHITESFLDGFVNWLDGVCPLDVRRAVDGAVPTAGTVHVAPEDRHLELVRGRMRTVRSEPVCYQRPSGTVLLHSLADSLGERAIGVVLTGMGDDGATGLQAIRTRGGYTIAEHESTAIVYGMPRAAAEVGGAREQLPCHVIGPRLMALAARAAERIGDT